MNAIRRINGIALLAAVILVLGYLVARPHLITVYVEEDRMAPPPRSEDAPIVFGPWTPLTEFSSFSACTEDIRGDSGGHAVPTETRCRPEVRLIWGFPLLALFLAAPAPLPAPGETGMLDVSASVVGIVEMDTSHHATKPGTGFFISPGGLVLTNAHVVHRAFTDPGQWPIVLVLVNRGGWREWYRATIVCSSPSGEGGPGSEMPFTMDQAVLQVGPADNPFTWGYALPNGHRYEYEPHDGPLPEFPALTLAKNGPRGMDVRTIGFSDISALPRLFTATGQVTRTFSGQDGTPYLEVRFANPPTNGASGSPILDATGEVVGMLSRVNLSDSQVLDAISATALSATCGK